MFFENGTISPTEEIIDLVASRRKQVALKSIVQLREFNLPEHLLSRYGVGLNLFCIFMLFAYLRVCQ